MTSREDIISVLMEILGTANPQLDLSQVSPQSSFLHDLGLNSLSMMLLTIAVEDRFHVSFEGKSGLDTVADVVDCILSQIS